MGAWPLLLLARRLRTGRFRLLGAESGATGLWIGGRGAGIESVSQSQLPIDRSTRALYHCVHNTHTQTQQPLCVEEDLSESATRAARARLPADTAAAF